jgi:alpha-D-ribose 1-methylphosphonate 5-triphosphate synthase subunit PhnI
MGYVAVRGGTEAIEASIERLKYERLRKKRILDADAVEAGMRALVDQVMSEASLYDERVAALSIKQAEGSPEEAVFLMRAFRSTLPRRHCSLTIEAASMRVERRISASFKDVPGGQILGASCDYTHRLIDEGLAWESEEEAASWVAEYLERTEDAGREDRVPHTLPSAIDYVRELGLIERRPLDDAEPLDVTRKSIAFPTKRSERLQILSRGQTGAVTALGYAALRGYGATLHPTVGELRVGSVEVYVPDPFAAAGPAEGRAGRPEDAYYIGRIRLTEAETLVPVHSRGPEGERGISFDIGYGAAFGQNETKAIAMSVLDQCLESGDKRYPTQDEEFVLLHVDSVEATGFISHLKLPHYVTFQSKLDAARKSREERP